MLTPVGVTEAGGSMIEPGALCPTCHRRKNKPKQSSSPDTKVVSIGRLPVERQEALTDGLDALAEYTGAVKHSYPKGVLLEALVALGAAQREELKAYFAKAYGEHEVTW